jgi:hypothetical protein
LEEIYKLVKTT